MLRWITVEAPVGPVSAGCSETGVAEVCFGPPPAGADGPAGAAPEALVSAAQMRLAEYFAGQRRVFDLPLDWGTVSGTRQQVLALLAESVRFGETITYGALAQRLADRDGRPPVGARAIGRMMGSNPIPVIVPCHRVVASDGLGGFSGGCGPELKRWLLTFEDALPAMLDFGEPLFPATR